MVEQSDKPDQKELPDQLNFDNLIVGLRNLVRKARDEGQSTLDIKAIENYINKRQEMTLTPRELKQRQKNQEQEKK